MDQVRISPSQHFQLFIQKLLRKKRWENLNYRNRYILTSVTLMSIQNEVSDRWTKQFQSSFGYLVNSSNEVTNTHIFYVPYRLTNVCFLYLVYLPMSQQMQLANTGVKYDKNKLYAKVGSVWTSAIDNMLCQCKSYTKSNNVSKTSGQS